MSWKRGPLKHWLKRNESGVWGDEPTGAGDVEVLRSTDISLDGAWSISDPAVRSIPPDQFLRKRLESGDLVVVTSSGSPRHLGKTAIVTTEVANRGATFANFVQRLTPRADANSRYIWYLLNSKLASDEMAMLGNTTTGLRNLNGQILGSITSPGPPLEMQREIANYLDSATARIDALIAKKRRMIAFLAERRHAVISRTLWQQGWPLTRLKYLCGLPTSGNRDHGSFTPDDLGVPCLRGLNVRAARLDLENLLRISVADHDRLKATQLRAGDLVIVRSGLAGSAAVVPDNFGPCNCVDLVVVRKSRIISPRLLEFVINSTEAQEQVTKYSAGALLTHFNAADAGNLQIPVPPVAAQSEVLADLETRTVALRHAFEALTYQVDLLVERRQAIITAAVTGELSIPDAA